MIDYQSARKVAELLAAVAEPTRLQIVSFLLKRPHYVGELAELIGIPIVNMSHHLSVMRQAGLLEDVKQGRRVRYHFREEIYRGSNGAKSEGMLDFGHLHLIFPYTSEPSTQQRTTKGSSVAPSVGSDPKKTKRKSPK